MGDGKFAWSADDVVVVHQPQRKINLRQVKRVVFHNNTALYNEWLKIYKSLVGRVLFPFEQAMIQWRQHWIETPTGWQRK